MTKAKIKVSEVTGFCCSATVELRGKKVHETRDYPYGQRANAYASAEAWATEHGFAVAP